jgi:hypothetical protein
LGKGLTTSHRKKKERQLVTKCYTDLKGRDHTEDPDIDGKILDWILGKEGGKV